MKYGLLLLSFCLALCCRAQNCNNIGFENGTTSGWTLSYGSVAHDGTKTTFNSEIFSTTNSQHLVTRLSDGNDPNIFNEAIPQVAPGSNYSIRIGNLVPGTNFARIQTSFIVTADNDLLQYKFAVVLQNTNEGRQIHQPYEKPGFNLQVLNEDGSQLACSYYDIQLQGQQTVDGFQSQGELQFRNWTVGSIDLKNQIGKKITVIATAYDCTGRAHYGYAYFDAQCMKSGLNTVSACPDANNQLTLTAPEGFSSYLWNTGETSSTIKVSAELGKEYSVFVTPPGSLDASCKIENKFAISYKELKVELTETICEGESYRLGATDYTESGIYVNKIASNSVCDSTVTLRLTVIKKAFYSQKIAICEGEKLTVGDTTYTTSGHYVKLMTGKSGCDSTVTTDLYVDKITISSVANQYQITEGDSIQLQTAVDPAGAYIYAWNPPNNLSCNGCLSPWASPIKSTAYILKVSNEYKACNPSDTIYVTVMPCGVNMPDVFTPNGRWPNDIFYVLGNSCISSIKEFAIYNRWGEVIFQRANFKPSDPQFGWDGLYKGQLSANGIYTYKIVSETRKGTTEAYRGQVTLVR